MRKRDDAPRNALDAKVEDAGGSRVAVKKMLRGNGPDGNPEHWMQAVQQWMPPADLCTRDVKVQWAVEGWIQEGKVGALVAAGGTGKTTLLLVLGICIALGWPFFGHRVKRGAFLLLSNDDTQADLDAALALVMQALQMKAEDAAVVMRKLRVISLLDLTGVKTFTTTLGGNVEPTDLALMLDIATEGIDDLVGVALDTLRQFAGGSSNDEQVIKLTIAGATEFALKRRAFVVIPHHTGKQNYREGVTDMYCGSGSAAIADNCRFVLLLQATTWADIEAKVKRTGRERGAPLVLQSTRGSLLVKAPEPIYLHREGFYFGRVAGATLTRDQIEDERDREVLRAVHRGAQTKSDIAAAVGGRREFALNRIDDLVGRGHLSSPNGSATRPKYVVTVEGARFLEAGNGP